MATVAFQANRTWPAIGRPSPPAGRRWLGGRWRLQSWSPPACTPPSPSSSGAQPNQPVPAGRPPRTSASRSSTAHPPSSPKTWPLRSLSTPAPARTPAGDIMAEPPVQTPPPALPPRPPVRRTPPRPSTSPVRVQRQGPAHRSAADTLPQPETPADAADTSASSEGDVGNPAGRSSIDASGTNDASTAALPAASTALRPASPRPSAGRRPGSQGAAEQEEPTARSCWTPMGARCGAASPRTSRRGCGSPPAPACRSPSPPTARSWGRRSPGRAAAPTSTGSPFSLCRAHHRSGLRLPPCGQRR